jgi:hypothetical protein
VEVFVEREDVGVGELVLLRRYRTRTHPVSPTPFHDRHREAPVVFTHANHRARRPAFRGAGAT